MTAPAVRFPTDPDHRRRLWREWTHTDGPADPSRRPGRGAVPASARPEPVAVQPVDDWAAAAIDATPGVLRGLRAAIDAAIIDGHLAPGDRARLIARSVRLGLTRFEANLLVAAVQHRAIDRRPAASNANDYRVVSATTLPRRRRSVGALVATCVALEAVAALAVAAWLRG